MLTQEQLDELLPLTKHPKYGKLLEAAIAVWCESDVTPVHGSFGVLARPALYTFYNRKECCVLGASLLNKSIVNRNYYDSIQKYYDIPTAEIIQIQEGFDKVVSYNEQADAYLFGLKVREIVKPETAG